MSKNLYYCITSVKKKGLITVKNGDKQIRSESDQWGEAAEAQVEVGYFTQGHVNICSRPSKDIGFLLITYIDLLVAHVDGGIRTESKNLFQR